MTTLQPNTPALKRTLGLGAATALNMLDMIGAGPFLTMPLVLAIAGSRLAIAAWILAAVLALSDGLVWAELGAAFPDAGGSYAFLRELYGRERWGRLISFLYVWQLSFSAPMSIASGCLGFAGFVAWMLPALHTAPIPTLPWLHSTNLLAAFVALAATTLLSRSLSAVARLLWTLFAGVLVAAGIVIAAGLHQAQLSGWHIPHITPQASIAAALAQAMLLATYDYWGYYNVTFLGAEVKNPSRTIPRAILLSIALTAALYCGICLAVLPSMGTLLAATHADSATRLTLLAEVARTSFGPAAAMLVATLIAWTAFGSVFSLLLGYSRVPYAAAVDGNYFHALSKLDPRSNTPQRSLAALGIVSAACCLFTFTQVVTMLVVTRILLQFLFQQVGVLILRAKHPERTGSFRMPLFPLPPLIAITGFLFLLISRPGALKDLAVAAAIGLSGTGIYLLRARAARRWPFRLLP